MRGFAPPVQAGTISTWNKRSVKLDHGWERFAEAAGSGRENRNAR
jgi:hypothetical protein